MRRWLRYLGCVGTLSVSGCGNTLYAMSVTRASDELARAEQLEAAEKAPYEYYYALEHLRKARSEAARADYGDALVLAEAAYEHARRAIQVAQRVAPLAPVKAREAP
jgi:hypothetical protein